MSIITVARLCTNVSALDILPYMASWLNGLAYNFSCSPVPTATNVPNTTNVPTLQPFNNWTHHHLLGSCRRPCSKEFVFEVTGNF